jgi:hypothetical protein
MAIDALVTVYDDVLAKGMVEYVEENILEDIRFANVNNDDDVCT